jgi:STE24 endopeptidase
MSAHLLFKCIIALLLSKTLLEVALELTNAQHALKFRRHMPKLFLSFIDESRFDRSIEYTVTKSNFTITHTVVSACVLMLILVFQVLPTLYYTLIHPLGNTIGAQALTVFLITFILGLPELPFEWWSQFKIETAFGFNKSTVTLWLTDKLKGLLLSLLLMVPMLSLLLFFFQRFPETWWMLGSCAFILFQLLLLIVYPKYILPIFNKLTPLTEGSLKDRLFLLAKQCRFPASKILVMDGSRRSGHSNAFFTGFGRFRNIILFDTLIEQLTVAELEAVLAHEIGHYKKKHVLKRLFLMAVSIIGLLYSVNWFCKQNWFFEAFSFSQADGMGPAIMIFSIFISLIFFWLTPLSNLWSRKHEYEADQFASKVLQDPKQLIQALQKLHKENLGNLVPHPVYSFFHYSHPTLLERQHALERICTRCNC